jgi:hypothetical protein
MPETRPDASPTAAPELLVPDSDVQDPEVSLVIPALNEEITIGLFLDWCKEGLAEAGTRGEVLIVDSSTDRTTAIALSKGARVLRTARRGLGRAYIDSVPFIRGKYVILGDCDCTYDFRELSPFVEKFRAGAEFVMGSRMRGYIEPGAMPALHRYMGTPVTTWLLNFIFSSRFSDIHCGMRGITRAALERMRLRSQSWEYASEMVLKSVHMSLRTDEVPIRFLKDQDGRLSHHKRSGWLSPWSAAWINVRAMLVYGADFFLFRPGFVLTILGLALLVPLSFGPIQVGPMVLSIHWMLLGLTLATLGIQCVFQGILAQVFFDYSGEVTQRWLARFEYTRTVCLSLAAFVAGVALNGWLVAYYLHHAFRLTLDAPVNNLGVTGIFLMIAGFVTFTFTLLLHSTAVVAWR